MSNGLDRVATIVFIVACVGVVALVGYRQFAPQRSTKLVAYEPGDRLESGIQSQLRNARPSLIVNLRSTCQYCAVTIPSLQELIAEANGRWPDLQVAAASVEPNHVFLPYVATTNLKPEVTIRLNQMETVLSRMVVPSLVIADAKGVVVGRWLGVPTDAQLKEVVNSLDNLVCPDGCNTSPAGSR